MFLIKSLFITQENTMQHKNNTRAMQRKAFCTHDDENLFYRYWPAVSDKPKGAIVLFHRGHEHSGRLTHIVEELNLQNYACFAWDARGHGRSPGDRGYSPSLATSVRDVQTFIDHISENYNVKQQDIAVIAQSVGAVLVSTWVHDYAPKIRCMVLASPAFKVKLYVPFARSMIKIKQALKGHFYINSYVKAKFLTHDKKRIKSFENDDLITRPISSNILLSLYETAERIVADANAIKVPTQLLISGDDWVVHHKPQHQFYERLGSPVKERHIFKGFYHDTLGEKDRYLAIDKMREFIEQRFAEKICIEDQTNADKSGYTRDEADKLATPKSIYSLSGAYWALSRVGLKFGGKLSAGVKLGQNTGFDSGSTLDYVYKNKPTGFTSIGRAIDRSYLNSIGWRGIRQRKLNIEGLVSTATENLRKSGKPVDIMDIASGHGRYILEAIEKEENKPDSILLRDYSDLNVVQGSKLIQEKGLENIAKFIEANAFDIETYHNLDVAPTLGVVSGLYELFADNKLIRTSLQGFSDAIEEGGYLIYTGQPWHPQLEMIARSLTSHREGDAWVMRRRTQLEMDQLVEQAGFTKIEQRIDEFGIFTVSLAIKNTSVASRKNVSSCSDINEPVVIGL